MTGRIDVGATFTDAGVVTNRPDVGVGHLFIYDTGSTLLGTFDATAFICRVQVTANTTTAHPNANVKFYTPNIAYALMQYGASNSDAAVTSIGQGAYFGWNRTGGQGETDFVNHHGGGGGGWYFYDTNGTTWTLRASIDGSGVFNSAGQTMGVQAHGAAGAAVALNFAVGNFHTFVLSASTNCTVTFGNPAAPCMCWIRADGAAASTPTITWPAVKGTALQTTITATKSSLYGLWFDGASYWNTTGITLVNL